MVIEISVSFFHKILSIVWIFRNHIKSNPNLDPNITYPSSEAGMELGRQGRRVKHKYRRAQTR